MTQIITRRLLFFGGSVLITLGLAVLLFPFLPWLRYEVSPIRPIANADVEEWVEQSIQKIQQKEKTNVAEENVVLGKYLFIPRLGLMQPVVEGASLDVLDEQEGVWRDTRSIASPEQGNMAIAGHRFRFRSLNKETFYHLDRLQEGDEIVLWWNGEQWTYRVTKIETVRPSAVEVLDSHGQPELTLYTCGPRGTMRERLVVHTELQSHQ